MQGTFNFDNPISANTQASYIQKFETSSPINIERLSGQNKRLYDYLAKGNKIHCLHPAKEELGIGYLNSRISDLIHKNKVPIIKESITAKDKKGNDVDVVLYSMQLKPSNKLNYGKDN